MPGPPPQRPGGSFRARALVRSLGAPRVPLLPNRRASIKPSSSATPTSSPPSTSSRGGRLGSSFSSSLAGGRFSGLSGPVGTFATGAALGGLALGAGVVSSPTPPNSGDGASKRAKGGATGGGFGSPGRRATDALLVANCAVFLLQALTKQRLTVAGAKINAAIAAGEWWRLLTPALLHGNLMHLATNNYALSNLGPLVERLSGTKRFAVVYVASAVAGTLASYAATPFASVGASGAIFGLGGALAVFFWRHRDYFGKASDAVLAQLGQSLAVNVVMGLVVSNVDNWGHAGGLAGGAATALLLGPRMVRRDEGKVKKVCDEPPCRWLAGPDVVLK